MRKLHHQALNSSSPPAPVLRTVLYQTAVAHGHDDPFQTGATWYFANEQKLRVKANGQQREIMSLGCNQTPMCSSFFFL